MSRNHDSTTGNLLDFSYHQNYCKLIGIALYQDKQIRIFLNKLIFVVKLEEDDGAVMFFIAEKQQKTILNFSLNLLIVTE